MKTPILAALGLFVISCSAPKKPDESAPAVPTGDVKITQFYADASRITAGDKAMICYGVENAKSVKLQPDVERLAPAFTRCFNVTPQRSTRYTLTAQGFADRSVSASFEIEVAGLAAAPSSLPVIHKFEIKPKEPGEDKPPTLCYAVEDADAVEITPNAMPMSGVLQGCLYVNLKVTTTYTLTAHGVAGKTATKQLTVPAP